MHNQYKILAEKYNKVGDWNPAGLLEAKTKLSIDLDRKLNVILNANDFEEFMVDTSIKMRLRKKFGDQNEYSDNIYSIWMAIIYAHTYLYRDPNPESYLERAKMYFNAYLDKRKAQELHQKNTEITGIDTSGLLENDNPGEDKAEDIITKAREVTKNYLKLLNNKRVPGLQLADYIRLNVYPIIQEVESYITKSKPHELEKLRSYLRELLTTTWLTVDRVYWDVEMDTIVRGAVEDGKVVIPDLQQLANKGNKRINTVSR